MVLNKIQIGQEYAFREKRWDDFQRVRIIERARGYNFKAEWISPTRGVIDYVQSTKLVCPWREKDDFLKYEKAHRRMKEYSAKCGYKSRSPLNYAVEEVMRLTGESQLLPSNRGVWIGPPDVIARIYARVGWSDKPRSEVAYLDQKGNWNIPYDEALAFVKKFCETEPGTVLFAMDIAEKHSLEEAAQSHREVDVTLLTETKAMWQIIREWAGEDSLGARLQRQIKTLQRIGWDAVEELERANLHDAAARLRRRLERA